MIRKDDWNDFNFFEFTKARFMAQDVIYPGEGSVCTWESPYLSLFTSFISKSILSDVSIATPAFLWSPFAWNIFFPGFHFLYVSLVLRWVSCRQHIYGSCFCIHSARLCLLVGAFNPFTFKVIIDKYDPIAIYFVVWGLNLYTFSVFPV